MASSNLPIMPEITDAFLSELLGDIIGDDKNEAETFEPIQVIEPNNNPKLYPNAEPEQKVEELEENELAIDFELYDTDQDEPGQDIVPLHYLYSQNKSNKHNKLENNQSNHTSTRTDKDNVASKTIQEWLLTGNNLIVYPIWIGNLPRDTTTTQLRHFVQSHVGKVTISIHINNNNIKQQHIYAFINLPTAEKQFLAVTLLDGIIFNQSKLTVRANKPLKFPQASFFSSGNSSICQQQFKRFRDHVVPVIISMKLDINVSSVGKVLEINDINVDALPNRVFSMQCTLHPKCTRTYCSFYHCDKEKELGRIISQLLAQDIGNYIKKGCDTVNTGNIIRSRHTLLVQGLTESNSKKIEEIFDVFGEIDIVMVNGNNMCYVRMKYAQDASKIVHLFRNNRAVHIDFAPYQARSRQIYSTSQDHLRLDVKSVSEPVKNGIYCASGYYDEYGRYVYYGYFQTTAYQNQQQVAYGHGHGHGLSGRHLGLRNAYSDIPYSQNGGVGYNPANKQ